MASNATRELHSSEAPLDFSIDRLKLGDLLPDCEYNTCANLLAAYRTYAYNKGYGVVLDYTDKNKKRAKIIYMCDKGGKPRDRKNENLHPSKKRPNAGLRKTNCPFRIIA